jgi:hypothetical protein
LSRIQGVWGDAMRGRWKVSIQWEDLVRLSGMWRWPLMRLWKAWSSHKGTIRLLRNLDGKTVRLRKYRKRVIEIALRLVAHKRNWMIKFVFMEWESCCDSVRQMSPLPQPLLNEARSKTTIAPTVMAESYPAVSQNWAVWKRPFSFYQPRPLFFQNKSILNLLTVFRDGILLDK